MQMFQPHRKAALVRQNEAMAQDGRAEPSTLKSREQVELAEPHMVRSDLEGKRAKRLLAPSNLEERLLVKPAAMEIALECLIPGPTTGDMGTHGGTLGLEGKADGLSRSRQQGEREVGRQVGQVHAV